MSNIITKAKLLNAIEKAIEKAVTTCDRSYLLQRIREDEDFDDVERRKQIGEDVRDYVDWRIEEQEKFQLEIDLDWLKDICDASPYFIIVGEELDKHGVKKLTPTIYSEWNPFLNEKILGRFENIFVDIYSEESTSLYCNDKCGKTIYRVIPIKKDIFNLKMNWMFYTIREKFGHYNIFPSSLEGYKQDEELKIISYLIKFHVLNDYQIKIIKENVDENVFNNAMNQI